MNTAASKKLDEDAAPLEQLNRIAREYEIVRDGALKGSPLYESADRVANRLRAKIAERRSKEA